MLCSLANNMKEDSLQAINDLEKDLGKTLLAFRCHDLKHTLLSSEELAKVEEVEKKLGVSLVAVEQ